MTPHTKNWRWGDLHSHSFMFPMNGHLISTMLSCVSDRFKQWGFEKGWGDTAERVKETMRSLSELLQAPDPFNLEKFFSRIPMIFNIVIISPHGYFGQSDVLGLPDTGGQVHRFWNVNYIHMCLVLRKQMTCFFSWNCQVVYILDQVKAMEEELLLRRKQQGIDVKPQILVVSLPFNYQVAFVT